MANLNVRRGGTPERSLASAWNPMGGMDPLQSWDPVRMLRDLMGMDPFGGMVSAGGPAFAPDIEVKETKDSYMLRADLPGVREGDLEVSVVGNRLSVSGKREEEERHEGDRFFAYERSYGSFNRSFMMPEGADLDAIKADLREGVLEISIPKKADLQARRIQVGKGTSAGGEPTSENPSTSAGPKKAA